MPGPGLSPGQALVLGIPVFGPTLKAWMAGTPRDEVPGGGHDAWRNPSDAIFAAGPFLFARPAGTKFHRRCCSGEATTAMPPTDKTAQIFALALGVLFIAVLTLNAFAF